MRPTHLALSLFVFTISLIACGAQDLDVGNDSDTVDPAASETDAALAAATGAQVVVKSSADTYVRSGNYAARNYGSTTSARCDLDDGKTEERLYLRFNVGNVGPIKSAMLRFWVVNASTNSANISTLGVTSWDEAALTWNTKPASQGTLLGALGATTAGRWTEFDVTKAVSANTQLSFLFTGRSADGFGISTRESGSNAPSLVITLDAAPVVVVAAPLAGAELKGVVTLKSDAADDKGVTNVEFLVDGVSVGGNAPSNGSASLGFDTRGLTEGSHSVVARATDTAGQRTSSVPVAFTVKNVVVPLPVDAGTTNDAGIPAACSVVVGAKEIFHTSYPHAFCTADGKAAMLNGFNVRNVGLYSSPSSASAMKMIKDKGFNAVRFVMRWSVFEPSPGGTSADAEAKLDASIANAKAAGLYIILDPIHLSGGGDETPAWATGNDSVAKVNSFATPYLKRMAAKFANERSVVAIDLVNEPWMAGRDDARLMTMYNTLIAAVRSVDSDKPVIMEPMYGDSLFASSAFALLKDTSNLIFSTHDYYGGTTTATGTKACASDANGDGYHDTYSYACGSVTYNETPFYNGRIADKEAHLRATLDVLSGPRLPLYVGEYNINEEFVGAGAWRRDMAALFDKYKISRTAWEFYSQGPMSATTNVNGSPGTFKTWVNELL